MSMNLLRLFAACTVLASPSLAFGQAENVSTLPWAYSTFFGTGWYQIGDDRNSFSIRYAPRKPLRESSIGDDGTRTVGIEMRFPVTVGLDHFPLDDLGGSVNPKNLANVSVTPSIYFEIPMNERWTLLPFVAAGWDYSAARRRSTPTSMSFRPTSRPRSANREAPARYARRTLECDRSRSAVARGADSARGWHQ